MTYSSTMSVGRRGIIQRGQNSVSFKVTDKRLGPISNTIVLILLACLLGLLYLTQVTKTNAYGYAIDRLQTEQTNLQVEHDNLQVASARLQAIDGVEQSAEARALVPVSPSGIVR